MSDLERPPDHQEILPVLQQVLRFLDLTRDIERNLDDSRFHRAGGRIHYVFDENVFETLVAPKRWGERMQTFHSTAWAPSQRDWKWRSVAGQSALLAAEYLFSGNLPGQRDHEICVTEWHLWELRDRIDQMARTFAERAAGDRTRRGRVDQSLHNQAFLLEDVERLRHEGGRWTNEAIERFVLTRTTAQSIVDDDIIEPMEQMRRIVSLPLRDRIQPLHERFNVPEASFEQIGADARFWLQRLTQESERRGHGASLRKPAALVSDARALALVDWAARTAQRKGERVVYVTNDNLAFDAYRRRYTESNPYESGRNPPFVMRRLVQYAPIFNMNDSSGDISEARELFDMTREAVEVALLPFNLAQFGATGEVLAAVNRGREFLALLHVDYPDLRKSEVISYFAKSLSKKWLRESKHRVALLTHLWQRTERTAIGSMYGSLETRVTMRRARRVMERAERGREDLGAAASGYVERLLDQILSESIALWSPLARRFIEDTIQQTIGRAAQRARPPILVRIGAERDAETRDLVEALLQMTEGGGARSVFGNREGQALVSQPEILFAVAAVMALSIGNWANAERFADLARRASEIDNRYHRPIAADIDEFRYLHAVALRFRMGGSSPAFNEGIHAALERGHHDALEQLDLCLAGSDGADGFSTGEILRVIRASSERAALNLFFWAATHLSGVQAVRDRARRTGSAVRAFEESEADLLRCHALASDLQASGLLDGDQIAYLTKLQRQYLANSAAAALVGVRVLRRTGKGPLASDALLGAIEDLVASDQDFPPIVAYELAAYLTMHDRPIPPAWRKTDFEKIIRQDGLPLDVALYEALKRGLPKDA